MHFTRQTPYRTEEAFENERKKAMLIAMQTRPLKRPTGIRSNLPSSRISVRFQILFALFFFL